MYKKEQPRTTGKARDIVLETLNINVAKEEPAGGRGQEHHASGFGRGAASACHHPKQWTQNTLPAPT